VYLQSESLGQQLLLHSLKLPPVALPQGRTPGRVTRVVILQGSAFDFGSMPSATLSSEVSKALA
jgi:hypothetical protein